MKDQGRLLFWTLFLAAAGMVAILPEWLPPGGETVEAVARGASAELRMVPLPAGPEAKGRAGAAGLEEEATNLFAAKTWVAPPPPASPSPALLTASPPPPPAAPPLPFTFMGRFDDGAILKAFLQRGERAYVVAAGDVIDGTYRVEAIAPGQITLTYLPLDTPQRLSLGSPP